MMWLPGAHVAKIWQQYVATGKVDDTTPPDAPTDVTVVKNAQEQTELTWSAAADFESGLQAFEILRDGQPIGRVPEVSKGKFGRPLFQGLSYHDTPEAPLAEMKFIDAKTEPDKKYEYRIVAVNGLDLKSTPSEPAKESEARAAVELPSASPVKPAGGSQD
ncbi:MAG: fibronectin type III domain-containing protein [Pirellulales bacterium]